MIDADVERFVGAAITEGTAPEEWDMLGFNEMFLPIFHTSGPVEIAGTEEAKAAEERIKKEAARKQAELAMQRALNPDGPAEDEETEPDEQIVGRIKKIPYVTAVAPVVDVNAIIQSSKKLGAVNILAVNPSEYPENDLLASSLDNGQFNALARTPYGIILGARLAQELDLVPGEKVRIMFPLGARYSITGRIPAQRLFTYIGSFYLGSEADGSVGLINLEDGQKVMRLGKKFSGYRVWLEDPFMIERFISDYGSQNVVDWRREKGPLFQAIAMEKKMMSLMLFLIVFVAVFNILSSLIMTVIDKTREIAIMRTMGLKSRTVMQIFMIEGLWCGFIGTVLGTLLGLPCALYLNQILHFLGVANMFLFGQPLPVLIEPLQIAIIILSSIALTTAATIYPAYKAARILPAEALRYE